MPRQPIVKQYKGADALWLFSKVILYLLGHLVSILLAVVLAVWAGASAFINTESRLIGLAVGVAAYMAGMSGREWLNWVMVRNFFDTSDMKEMDNQIEDKRGPTDP